jgi:23S rRNA (cytidine1920-2'-O)/16S rRNA (cytidine1409-2'-O)-methyltransferase
MGRQRPRFVNVMSHVRSTRPDIADPVAAIASRRLTVGGRIVTSTRSLVPADAAVTLRPSRPLRGEDKLRVALDAFGVEVPGRTCLDVGASAGGFTRVLLERGAIKVIAVDAGHGQLRGFLRVHSRVLSLERTNLSELGRAVPRCWDVDLITMDLSYLSVAEAVPQLEALRVSPDADLIALVKPMFELHLSAPPTEERQLRSALERARRGVERQGRWAVAATMTSPVTGTRGAREWLLHARRTDPAPGRLGRATLRGWDARRTGEPIQRSATVPP